MTSRGPDLAFDDFTEPVNLRMEGRRGGGVFHLKRKTMPNINLNLPDEIARLPESLTSLLNKHQF